MKKIMFFYVLAALALSLVGCGDSGFDTGKDSSLIVHIEDGVFVDQRDGERYRVIKVGSDVWLAENLRYKDSTESPNLEGNMWCPDDDPAKCAKFGPLYSWTAARNVSSDYSQRTLGRNISQLRGICPEGFRLPTNSDWVYLAMVADKFSAGKAGVPTSSFMIPPGTVSMRYPPEGATWKAGSWRADCLRSSGRLTR